MVHHEHMHAFNTWQGTIQYSSLYNDTVFRKKVILKIDEQHHYATFGRLDAPPFFIKLGSHQLKWCITFGWTWSILQKDNGMDFWGIQMPKLLNVSSSLLCGKIVDFCRSNTVPATKMITRESHLSLSLSLSTYIFLYTNEWISLLKNI